MEFIMEELSHSLEDYLEAILIISQNKKTVRVKDLVKRQGVKTSSVIGALKKLGNRGLVEHELYGYIELTSKGIKEATKIYEKHKVLYKFLTKVLGVNKNIAEKDACLIEHYISDDTFDKMIKFIRFIELYPDVTPLCLDVFKNFMKTGKLSESKVKVK
jgi:DtxR family Mn-dependent transcriptional regulator